MRARNIKPAFFENEQLASLSTEARLLFIGLWCVADKRGILEERPLRLKMQLLPLDDVDVSALLAELAAVREPDGSPAFIRRYEVENYKFIQIVHFNKHQSPHRAEKESGFPPPPDALPEISCASTEAPEKEGVDRADRGILNEDSGMRIAEERGDVDTPLSAQADPPLRETSLMAAWNAMAKSAGLPLAKGFSKKRKTALRQRVRDPAWRDCWRKALDDIPRSPFLCGENPRGWRANLDWFLKPDSVMKIREGAYDGAQPDRACPMSFAQDDPFAPRKGGNRGS